MTAQCKARISSAGTWHRDPQCSRQAKKDGYCIQHHPDTVAERDKKRRKADDIAWQKIKLKIYAKEFYEALVKISEGHNDPRGLATEIIDNFNKG